MANQNYNLPLEDCTQQKDGLDCQEQGRNWPDGYCEACKNYQMYLAYCPEAEGEAMRAVMGTKKVA